MAFQLNATTSRDPLLPIQSEAANGRTPDAAISPRKLAYLDIGLFFSLRKLGTSRDRVCEVLNLSVDEYDYLCRLG